MANLTKSLFKEYKVVLALIFGFTCGCMLVLNTLPLNRTCKLDDTDREYNIMRNSRLKTPDMIILILSAPRNLEKRNTIRETWLKLKTKENFTVRYYFVLGSLGLDVDNVLHLSSEQSVHNDMLILPIHDGYENLTIKVLKSFVWLKEQLDVGLDFKFVLKCDDDSFVRLDNLTHEIQQIQVMYLKSASKDTVVNNDKRSPLIRTNIQTNNNGGDLYLYWGYFYGKAKVQTASKWKEKSWILCDNYLPYALGGGYVLSKNLVLFIAKNEDDLRLYNAEDVSVGTWLSSVNNVIRIHDIRFDTQWSSRGCQNNYLISHNLSIKEMHTLYQNVQSINRLCEVETVKRNYYLYNWMVPPSKCCKRT